jgi:Arc/MetJ-type ribon-helix-helix transcriptional regulator
MTKKIQVSFSDKQSEMIEKLKGEFGDTDSEVVRGIVIAWLAEKSFISTIVKSRILTEKSK